MVVGKLGGGGGFRCLRILCGFCPPPCWSKATGSLPEIYAFFPRDVFATEGFMASGNSRGKVVTGIGSSGFSNRSRGSVFRTQNGGFPCVSL